MARQATRHGRAAAAPKPEEDEFGFDDMDLSLLFAAEADGREFLTGTVTGIDVANETITIRYHDGVLDDAHLLNGDVYRANGRQV